MNVIQRICDRVAVMEHGAVVESGTVKDIFTNPQHVTTKKFVNSAFAAKIPEEVQKELQNIRIHLETFCGNGEYYWNSGMFLFRAGRYLEELKKYRPDILDACEKAM
ncbi:sugar phosphate nucleotidyltransferase, partial [Escherichia sp. TWPC-MK]